MLDLLSIIISLAIVALGVLEGRRWFGAYGLSNARLRLFADKLDTCSEGLSFLEVARGWVGESEAATRALARNLMRHFGKDPIQLHGRLGWVVDVDDLCNGKRHFKAHPAAVRLEAMPGLLTGAGILFTFLGLAAGVYGLDPTDSAQLTQGVKTLLGGMSLAFLTSIAGIGTALWWSWRAREAAAQFEAVFAHIAEVLHQKDFILMPEEMNYQMLDDMRSQSRALHDQEEVLTRALRRVLADSVFGEIRDLLTRAVAREDQTVAISGPLREVHHELKSISQHLVMQIENQRIMGVAVKRLLDRSTGEHVSGSAAAVAASGNGAAQAQFIGESLRVAENFKSIQSGQEATLASIAASAEQLEKMMKAARLANADIIKVHAALVRHLEGMDSHWANYREQLNAMQETLSTTLTGFDQQLDGSLKRVHGEFDGLIAQALDSFAAALKDFRFSIDSLGTTLQSGGDGAQEPAGRGLFGRRKS